MFFLLNKVLADWEKGPLVMMYCVCRIMVADPDLAS